MSETAYVIVDGIFGKRPRETLCVSNFGAERSGDVGLRRNVSICRKAGGMEETKMFFSTNLNLKVRTISTRMDVQI